MYPFWTCYRTGLLNTLHRPLFFLFLLKPSCFYCFKLLEYCHKNALKIHDNKRITFKVRHI